MRSVSTSAAPAVARASASSSADNCSSPAETTSTTADSLAQEVLRLREELQQCQQKFASWKEKAKNGVDSLRAQIVDLAQRLDRSEQTRVTEHRTVDSLQSSLVTSVDVVQAHSAAAASLLIDAFIAQFTGSQNAVTAPSPSLSQQDAIIKKLQRTIKDQSDQLKETHHALKRSSNEVQQHIEALRLQDETMASLKRRAEALEAANRSLEEQLMSVPNAEEWKTAQDELDHQLERFRLEYEIRESNLVLQHSNEIHMLNAAHEQDIRELQRDAQEKILQAVQNALVSQSQAAASASAQRASQRETEDSAYLDLLRDYKALEVASAAATKERAVVLNQQQMLLRELQGLFRAIGAGGIVSSSSASPSAGMKGGAAAGVVDTITVADAVRQIGEQRMRLVALQEDLSCCRREVAQLKRSKPSVPPDGLGAQQTQYVRSVVVQLLCSLNDATVAKRLLPVLSTLLKFSDDDLKAVMKAMPRWPSHR